MKDQKFYILLSHRERERERERERGREGEREGEREREREGERVIDAYSPVHPQKITLK